jgi:hypothetical protein
VQIGLLFKSIKKSTAYYFGADALDLVILWSCPLFCIVLLDSYCVRFSSRYRRPIGEVRDTLSFSSRYRRPIGEVRDTLKKLIFVNYFHCSNRY